MWFLSWALGLTFVMPSVWLVKELGIVVGIGDAPVSVAGVRVGL